MDPIKQSVQYLNEQESFVRELLILYKQHPVLWNQKHPNYRNRSERQEAYEILIEKCKEYFPEADEDFVRVKIDSMRSTFRREHRKVVASTKFSNKPEDIYKPSLWYYNLLLFTMNKDPNSVDDKDQIEEETEGPTETEVVPIVKVPFWTREYTAILIELYKKHSCLYVTRHPHYKIKSRRMDAIKKIANSMSAATGKLFFMHHVRRKITLIRCQFMHEYNKSRKSAQQGIHYKPSLWCYGMLSFLKHQHLRRVLVNDESTKTLVKKSRNHQSDDSEDSEEAATNVKNEEPDYLEPADHLAMVIPDNDCDDNDDIFDTIAKNVAHKLRDMTESQRNVAERIVKDVMYHGQMENLTPNSRLVLDGA